MSVMIEEKPKEKRKVEDIRHDFVLASRGNRVIALIVDMIIVSIVGGSLTEFHAGLGGLVSAGIGLLYVWFFWTRFKGQTPGKMLLGIRVVKTDGSPLNDTEAVLRYIGYLINSPVLMLGWIWAFIDKDKQGWHDKLAGTYVVKA